MAVFATDEKLTFLDINRIKGNIVDLIDKANEYVKARPVIFKIERIDIPENDEEKLNCERIIK